MINFLDKAKERLSNKNYPPIEKFFNKVISLCETDYQKKLLNFGVENTVIIFPLELDYDMIFAGIILPLIRENQINIEELKDYNSALELVNSVLKIENVNLGKDSKTEDIRSMLVAMAGDIRVIIIKLADTLNRARHMKDLTEQQKLNLHNQIVDIYVPLASRLGVSYIKSELQDLDLSYTNQTEYKRLLKVLAEDQKERQNQIEKVKIDMLKVLDDLKIKGEVVGRLKHVSSVYNKVHNKEYALNQIFDFSAVRILVQTLNECYSVLGAVHTKYTPLDGRFKDYIAKPKANGYQSLHTTVLIESKPLEIQIRTFDMHFHAEYGIAAHFLYKEQKQKINGLEDRLLSIKKLIENPNLTNTQEIIDELKTDVYSGEIFVQSPMGKIVQLPENSTPIDFAYAIHSDVGNKCVGARVNGKMVPLSSKLHSADVIEIITNPNAKGPSRDWLKVVATSQAKTRINQFFKKEMKEDNIKKGKLMLEQSAKLKGVDLKTLLADEWLQDVFNKYSLKSLEDMYAMIGCAGLTTAQVLNRLIACYEEYNTKQKDFTFRNSVKQDKQPDKSSIAELGSMMVKFAHCCNPVPGDQIVGFVSRGRGVTIHKADCKSLKSLEQARLMPLSWIDNTEEGTYSAKIRLIVKDSSGLLAGIVNKISEQKINIGKIESKNIKMGKVVLDIIVNISNKQKLEELITKLKNIENVLEVYRGEN